MARSAESRNVWFPGFRDIQTDETICARRFIATNASVALLRTRVLQQIPTTCHHATQLTTRATRSEAIMSRTTNATARKMADDEKQYCVHAALFLRVQLVTAGSDGCLALSPALAS